MLSEEMDDDEYGYEMVSEDTSGLEQGYRKDSRGAKRGNWS